MASGYYVNNKPDISHQQLSSILIENLKCLKDVEIDLSEKSLIAIMAPNGCGKSSILHALYCSFNIPNTYADVNYFSRFFRPTNLNKWNGCRFTIKYSFQQKDIPSGWKTKDYIKTPQRWCRYEDRPIRHVEYIGIESCVPSIELYSSKKGATLSKGVLNTKEDVRIKEIASRVMKRTYTEYCKQTTMGKELIGVTYSNIEYSSFSMGAGEQRIFLILKKIIKSPKYSLILIDEIDLLLHEDALSCLLDEIREICEKNCLQLIFTTHARSVLNKNYIAFRYLLQSPQGKTICLDKCYPLFLTSLTGQRCCEYGIFVEDELARIIVEQLCTDNGIKPYVDIMKFGTALMGVKTACGMVITDYNNMEKVLFVTDGDKEYFNKDWYEKQVGTFFNGNDPDLVKKREIALKSITRLVQKDDKVAPEEYYRECILNHDKISLSEGEKSIYDALARVIAPKDTHDYFKVAINNLGFNEETGTIKIVEILRKTKQWKSIVGNVQSWIDNIKPNIIPPTSDSQ